MMSRRLPRCTFRRSTKPTAEAGREAPHTSYVRRNGERHSQPLTQIGFVLLSKTSKVSW